MQLQHTVLAAAILAAFCASSANAADPSFPIDSQEAIDALDLGAEGDKTLSASGNSVFLFKNETPQVNVSGHGSLTVSTQGSFNGSAIARFEGAGVVNFTGFSNLTFKSGDPDSVYGLILGRQTNFGSGDALLESVTLEDVRLGQWTESKSEKADFWTKKFTTNQQVIVSGFDLTLHQGLESADFAGGLAVTGNNTVTIEDGALKFGVIDGSTDAVSINGGTVYLGTGSSKIDSLTTDGGINIGSGTLYAAASGELDSEGNPLSTINGNIKVWENGSFNWTSGSLTVEGNVRGEGSVSFGSETTSLEKLVINGTNASGSENYPNGVVFEKGGLIAADYLEINGTFASSSEGESLVTVRGENAVFNAHDGQTSAVVVSDSGTLSINESQSLTINGGTQSAVNVSAGSLNAQGAAININGSVYANSGTNLALQGIEGADDQAGTIKIKASEAQKGQGFAMLTARAGSTVNLEAGTVTIDAGLLDDAHQAVSSAAESFTLTADQTAITGSVINNGKMTMKASEGSAGSLLHIKGHVRNQAGAELNLSHENGTIYVETPEDAGYSYYSGIETRGTTHVAAENFQVDGRLSVADGGSMDVSAVTTTLNGKDRAVAISNDSALVFKDVDSENQCLQINSAGVLASGANSKLTVEAGSVASLGVVQANGATISLGTKDKRLSSVAITSGESQTPMLRSNGGEVSLYAEDISIQNAGRVAIDAFTYEREGEGKTGSMTIDASRSISIAGNIVAGKDGGMLDDEYARHNSTITIASAGSTQIAGNIYTFNADQYLTGNSSDGTAENGPTKNVVNLTLSGDDSWLKGGVVDEGASAADGTGTNLTLSQNAVWSNTGDSTVTRLTANEGRIEVLEGSVTAEAFEGTAEVALKGEVADDGSIKTTTFTARSAADDAHVDAHYQGVTSDDVVGRQLEGVSGVAATSYVSEGDLYGAYVQQTDAEGNLLSSSYAANTKLESFKGITASSLVQWRNQVNHLTKRLGDVRAQPGDIGAWVRVYGGQYEWGTTNSIDMTSTTIQAGGDGRIGDWIVGGALSYTDSRFDAGSGDAEGDMYDIALYASRLFEGGSYIDIVGRYGIVKNDISVSSMSIDTSSSAFGLSVEGGHQFRFLQQAYIEPQIELAYGFVTGDDDTASNGVRIDQDDYQSLAARVGFRAGFDFPENAGTFYGHVSYSYDFLGEADARAMKAGLPSVSLDEDLGGGWVTYGIGGQFRLGERSFAYGELERSSGGEVENPWAFNIGFRHLF